MFERLRVFRILARKHFGYDETLSYSQGFACTFFNDERIWENPFMSLALI